MDTKANGSRSANSIKNVAFGMSVRVISLLVNFVSRTFFIRFLGEACLGLNGLFTTILSLLSLAELGIGEAIAFYLYRPISEGDHEKLKKLISFYKFCYRIIGLIVFVVGLCLIPALPYLVNLETDTGYNLYLVYILYLSNTAITYLLFSYPQTVLTANQKQYVVSYVTIVFQIIMLASDIVVLFLSRNYVFYLIARILLACLQNFVVFLICKRKYPYITQRPDERISNDEIKKMFKDVYGVFVLKLSSKLVDSTDNLFISIFLGTIMVGYNSNYLIFTTAASSLIVSLIFGFSASVGDYNTKHGKEDVLRLFKIIDFINFGVSFSFAIFIFSFSNNFISLLWGEEMTFSPVAVALLAFNFFLTTSLNAVFMFRQSLGVFRSARYFQLLSALLNIGLDFAFVGKMGVTGLYLATVISNISLAVVPFIFSLFKNGFEASSKKQIVVYFGRCAYTVLFGFACYYGCHFLSNDLISFLLRILITLFVVVIGLLLTRIWDKQFQACFSAFKKITKR